MYQCGDKVVYPMYGAGVIDEVEEKVVDGNPEVYYHVSLPVGNLRLTLSDRKSAVAGLRPVLDEAELLAQLAGVSKKPVVFNSNWNQRHKENLEKMKTGRLDEVADVYRRLILRERERSLSSAEKKLLNTARQILVSEMSYVLAVDWEAAEQTLNRLLLG